MVSWYGRYRILVWMCVLIAVNQLGFGSIVPVVPLYAASFGVSPAAIGLTIALYGLARFLLAVPAGRLADRIGRRGTLALGGVVTVIGNLLCAVAASYALFLGARSGRLSSTYWARRRRHARCFWPRGSWPGPARR